jgi:Viral alkaline exonuclease
MQADGVSQTSGSKRFKCGDITFSKQAYIQLPDQFNSLNVNTVVADAAQVEIATQDQSSCKLWHNLRHERITASNFGRILCRKALPSEAFMRNLFGESAKSISALPLEYGRRHEVDAKEKYLCVKPDLHLHKCGLVINNAFSFFGELAPMAKSVIRENLVYLKSSIPYHTQQGIIQFQNQ